jgi:WhiB family redox-sensing transcriptional regulator
MTDILRERITDLDVIERALTQIEPDPSGEATADELAWMDRGACLDTSPHLFFIRTGETYSREVRAICDGCPVRELCLEWALRNDAEQVDMYITKPQGFFGGKTPNQRLRILKERRKEAQQ